MKRYNFICINCFHRGHSFKYCKYPITSYGILCFKKDKDNQISYLLVQRKDTMGYIDFIRCKYNDIKTIKILIEEMTLNEKIRLLTLSFDELWDDLWVNKKSRIFLNDYEYSKQKFQKLDIINLITNTLDSTKWFSQEYSIPKGRRNNSESTLSCAIREFCEETGYTRNDIIIKEPQIFSEEYFIGSNGVYYKHNYLLAELKNNKKVSCIDYTNTSQAGEVRKVEWFEYKKCMNIFRNYETSKRNLIYKAQVMITNQFKNKFIN